MSACEVWIGTFSPNFVVNFTSPRKFSLRTEDSGGTENQREERTDGGRSSSNLILNLVGNDHGIAGQEHDIL